MITPAPSTLTGVVERIIFLNEENHYTIAEFRPDSPSSAQPTAGRPAPARPTSGNSPSAAKPPARPEPVTIVGPLPGVECGETLHLTGEWTSHSQHGAQFKIASFKSELPSSVYGIRKYLGSGLVPGIGKVYANKIVDAFGTDTFRILTEESAKLRDVPGIGKKRVTAIKAAWDAKRTERELYIFLQTYGVTPGQCVKIAKHFGPAAQQILTREPYRVAREIDGIGFKTADRIAINLGFANDAPPRLDAGLIFALETLQEEGHTAFREADLIEHSAAQLETDSKFLAARIDALVANQSLIRHSVGAEPPPQLKVESPKLKDRAPPAPGPVAQPSTLNAQLSARSAAAGSILQPSTFNSQLREPHERSALVQLPHNDRAEQKIAATIARLTRVGSGLPPIKADAAVEWAEKKAGFTFADLQRTALKHALTHKVSILTGGPGTGKTSCLRALVEILRAKKVRVHLAAPTGRAAQRLAETTGGFASTIHRLLKYDPATGGFVANESAPLATDFLIVDEASMLDTRLAAALLQAVPSRAHLLLVGDTDQLPSVGAGNVLKDLIAISGQRSAVSCQLSAVSHQQTAVSGQPSAVSSGLSSLPHSTLNTQPAARSAALRSDLSTLNSQLSTSAAPALPVTRLSVIYRQKEQSGIVTTAHAINAGDASLPPAVVELDQLQVWSDLTFIVATDAEDCIRKVIQLSTEWIPQHLKWPHPIADVQVLAPMHKGVAGVSNLNVQLQAALNPVGSPLAGGPRSSYPARTQGPALRGPNGEFRPGDKIIQLRNNYDKALFNGDIGTIRAIDPEKHTLEAEFDGERHTFERGEFGDLALAYCCSIHKSQGSEYPVVIIPLLKGHFMMLQRNLIYTAITRGKKKVYLVGEPAAYAMAVRNSESKQRITHLREKILTKAN